jgi:hypothetical protein
LLANAASFGIESLLRSRNPGNSSGNEFRTAKQLSFDRNFGCGAGTQDCGTLLKIDRGSAGCIPPPCTVLLLASAFYIVPHLCTIVNFQLVRL